MRVSQPILLSLRTLQWWEEQELRELMATMGLRNFQRHRSNRFIMFSVQKPLQAS